MRLIKKAFTALLCFVLLVMAVFPANATETAEEAAERCEVTILLEDLTGTYPGEELKIAIADADGTVDSAVTITKETTWGKGNPMKITLPAPATYRITFPDLEEGYFIADSETKTPITEYNAVAGAYEWKWAFISSDPEEQNGGITSEFLDHLPTTNREYLVIENEEAEALYLEFLNAVSFIQYDDTWSGNEQISAYGTLLGQYAADFMSGPRYAEYYEEYVTGGSKEQYAAMPAFEQFLWTECYTRCAGGVNHSRGWEAFFGNEGNYEKMITRAATIMMTGNNAEVVKEAYLKLMDWQYNYIQENGYPFCFITNRSYMDEISGEPIKLKAPLGSLEAAKPTAEPEADTDAPPEETPVEKPSEPSEAPIVVTTPEPAKEEQEKGVWGDTLAELEDSMLTILVLIVLAGALGVVILIRKRKNIDSDNQGGNFLS